MTFDQVQFDASFDFDLTIQQQLKADWLQLMALAVWGHLSSKKIGSLARLRKRILEVGENLQSLYADRAWIPHPREQLKSGLGTSVKLRDSLLALEHAAKLIDSGDNFVEFECLLIKFRQALMRVIEYHELRWAQLLESQL